MNALNSRKTRRSMPHLGNLRNLLSHELLVKTAKTAVGMAPIAGIDLGGNQFAASKLSPAAVCEKRTKN